MQNYLYYCKHPENEGISNVLTEKASANTKIESQNIDFNNCTTIESIVELLNSMENEGLHLVSSDGVTVLRSKNMAQLTQNLYNSAINGNINIGNNFDKMIINYDIRHLTRTCNLREAVFNIIKQYIQINGEHQ